LFPIPVFDPINAWREFTDIQNSMNDYIKKMNEYEKQYIELHKSSSEPETEIPRDEKSTRDVQIYDKNDKTRKRNKNVCKHKYCSQY